MDWAAAEIVSTLSGKRMKETLFNWNTVPEFQSEAKELANAMQLEAVLKGVMGG